MRRPLTTVAQKPVGVVRSTFWHLPHLLCPVLMCMNLICPFIRVLSPVTNDGEYHGRDQDCSCSRDRQYNYSKGLIKPPFHYGGKNTMVSALLSESIASIASYLLPEIIAVFGYFTFCSKV